MRQKRFKTSSVTLESTDFILFDWRKISLYSKFLDVKNIIHIYSA